MTAIIGAEGLITGTTAGGIANGSVINGWTATVSHVVSEVTPQGTTIARRFRQGLFTVAGSVTGVPDDGGTSDPEAFTAQAAGNGTLILLAQSGNSWTLTLAVISGVTLSSDKSGDAAISFDFIHGDPVSVNDPSEAWT